MYNPKAVDWTIGETVADESEEWESGESRRPGGEISVMLLDSL